MKSWKDQVVVVTGAASGIGRSLAQQLAAKGCKLAIADVNTVGLDETAASLSAPVFKSKLDVSDRAAFETFARAAEQELGEVDIVINNAGVALLQPVQDMRYEDLEWLMGINFWGVIHGTHAFLPQMLARNSGTIVNISSLYGLMGWPANTAYCAAKFAVRGYTEAMRHDLHKTGVKAISVHPGGIRTNIVNNARFTKDDLGRQDKSKIVRDFDKVARTTADSAATIIIQGIERGAERVLIGADAKLLSFVQRLAPESYFGLVRTLQRWAR